MGFLGGPETTDRVRMVPDLVEIDGCRLRYAVSDNAPEPGEDDEPVWALNLHGFFAGGGMYWRESARLAAALGWRVVNPSFPAFGGSDPLPWGQLSMQSFAARLASLLDHLEVERAVVVGHSMGGAVAMRFAFDHPERTLGVVYRDGAGPSSWKQRSGLPTKVLSPVAPDVGMLVEILTGALVDVPDLAWGRAGAMVRGVWPDARLNFRSIADTFPVAAMLFHDDLDVVIAEVGASPIPVLPVWGRFDRLVPIETGREFGALVGSPVVWVTGGHSWMLPRPSTQVRLLMGHPLGIDFLEALDRRSDELVE